ncbi:MAG: type II toxin-antitoxin system VapC family toxin [Thermodesulfobacteriota bacterium]|nr:type II toxin-antitoxin system VapC family toxin [Thermodesulfobacteriota bacterium]
MIIIDTHIWVWWVHGDSRLTEGQFESLKVHEADIIGVSAITCWEIAKLVEYNRIDLHCSIKEWFDLALRYPGISLIDLTPEIAIESTQLPGKFHQDPADQIIVATARIYNCPLLTSDKKIIDYPNIKKIP